MPDCHTVTDCLDTTQKTQAESTFQPTSPQAPLSGAGDARWQGHEPGHLRHRRRRGVAAGAGGEADAAGGREQDGLLRRAPQQARQAQALPGAGVVRWQERAPGLLRHRQGGRAVRRTVAGGASGSGGAACSGAAADERGGAAAGTGGGADAARGRDQDGLLLREPRHSRPAQAL
eukprot:scaffold43389_cov68-Phaeocystis_antarctica.AAC.1